MAVDYTFTTRSNEVIEYTFEDQDEAPIDLTGAQYVKIHMKQGDKVVTRNMTPVVPLTDGKAEYRLVFGDLRSGQVSFEFEVCDSAGRVYRNDDLEGPFRVRRALA